MAPFERPAHLKKLYSAYAGARLRFAAQLAEILRLRSNLRCWSGASVLDVGCGDGAIAQKFAELGAVTTGIEYDMGRVRKMSRQHLGFRLIAGDAHALPFEARSFDFVTLCDVLEHVADAAQVLREISRVLRPSGIAYIGTVNRASLANLLFDPHYNAPLIPLMSKRVAGWYVTKALRLSPSYGVEKYFFRGEFHDYLSQASLNYEDLRPYGEKLRAGEFAAAPGRNIIRTVLKVPGLRRFAVWFSDTAPFQYFIAPGINALCFPRDAVVIPRPSP